MQSKLPINSNNQTTLKKLSVPTFPDPVVHIVLIFNEYPSDAIADQGVYRSWGLGVLTPLIICDLVAISDIPPGQETDQVCCLPAARTRQKLE